MTTACELMRHAVDEHGLEAIVTLEEQVAKVLSNEAPCPTVEIAVLASLLAERLSPNKLSIDEGVTLLRGAFESLPPPTRPQHSNTNNNNAPN